MKIAHNKSNKGEQFNSSNMRNFPYTELKKSQPLYYLNTQKSQLHRRNHKTVINIYIFTKLKRHKQNATVS